LYITFYSASGSSGFDEEMQVAEEKFNESKSLAEAAMHNLLENDVRNFPHLFVSLQFHDWSNCYVLS